MQVVGALLITALLIIPASAARSFAKTPEQMALYAALIGVISVFIGIAASLYLDTPAGPSIVFASAVLFFSSQLARLLKTA
jgi:zinc transport system permease protein